MSDTQRPTKADCVGCPGEIAQEPDGTWYHTRIEDFSHQAAPRPLVPFAGNRYDSGGGD